MPIDYTNYTTALTNFYKAAAEWKFSSSTSTGDSNELLHTLKEKARLLQIELKELPPSMVRPLVVEHIEKALSFKET